MPILHNPRSAKLDEILRESDPQNYAPSSPTLRHDDVE
jgi:hypothetical protein